MKNWSQEQLGNNQTGDNPIKMEDENNPNQHTIAIEILRKQRHKLAGEIWDDAVVRRIEFDDEGSPDE